MAENGRRAGGSWAPSRLVSTGTLDVIVVAACGAAAALLVLTIVGFSMASGRGRLLQEANEKLAALERDLSDLKSVADSESAALQRSIKSAQERIAVLEARPTAQDLENATAEAAKWREKSRLADSSISELNRALDNAKAEIADLKRREDALKSTMSTTDRSRRDLYDKVQNLSELLKRETLKLNESREKLRVAGEQLADSRSMVKGLEDELAKARDELARRQARIETLEREFADIPIIPLTDDLAKIKWEDIQKSVAARESREDRIDMLFRAKLVLAGTPFEAEADRSWQRERQERLASLEREAKLAYETVVGKIRSTPDAHEENLRLLNEILPKVRGSRYEDRIVRLIVKEKTYLGEGE